ncbi:MAG: porin [Candidatus Thiodiazotropha sp.]
MNSDQDEIHVDRNKLYPATFTSALLLTLASSPAAADILIGELADTKLSMFGIIDVGLLYQSEANPSEDRRVSVETSGLRQSVIGFKGERPLSETTKAFFNLEAHFDTDNGYFHGTGDPDGGDGILFRRQANLGVSGDWGSLTAGRQYGPALLAHIGTEPRAFKEQFSNLYGWAYNQLLTTNGAQGLNTNNDVGIFFSDSLQYRHSIGGLSFGILYSFGGQVGTVSDNSVWAFGATYNGPVVLSASYQRMKDQDTGNDNISHWGAGAAVPFGDFTAKINYLGTEEEDSNGIEVADFSGIGVGIDWRWRKGHTATLAYYKNENETTDGDDTKNLVLSNDWAIRPDTTLYIQAAFVDAGAAASLRTSIVADGNPVQDESTAYINVGLNYNF